MDRSPAERAAALRIPLLVAAALSGPLLIRIALVQRDRGAFSAGDVAGFASDLAVALAVAGLLELLARRGIAWLAVALVPWCLLQYAHYEHVAELGAALQWTFAGYLADPTFFLGSALSPTRPGLLLASLAIPCGLGVLAARLPLGRPVGVRLLAAGLVLCVAVGLLPRSAEGLDWRERHFVHHNAVGLLRPVASAPAATGERFFRADLSGEAVIPLPAPGTNVLLLVLEGLPALSVEPVSRHYGLQGAHPLESLSAMAREGWFAPDFVLHQRQTNRGLYALLCGDYPKLDASLAKMTLYLKDSTRPCLPELLARASYRTAYLQGAPLSFMYKDAFMPLAGFQRVEGSNDFAEPELRSFWGVDDRSLLRRGAEVARELQATGDPWFLAMLTVGTHHPAVVPDASLGGKTGLDAAIPYLNEALSEFLAALEEADLLDDTLVVVTSDESRGEDFASDLQTALSSSWGPFVMRVPGAGPRTIEAPFGQSDFALSIADFLGLDAAASGFVGRSLFRDYPSPRRVYFSNVFLRRTGALDGSGRLFFCDEPADRCARYAARPSRLFLPAGKPAAPSAAEFRDIRAAIEASRSHALVLGEEFEFDLIGRREVAVRTLPEHQLLHGQNLQFPARSRIEVDITLRVEGGPGRMDLAYRMKERNFGDRVSLTLEDLAAGDVAVIRYAYESPDAMKVVKFALSALADRPDSFAVHFDRARVSVAPWDTSATRPGLIGEPEVHVQRRTPSP